MGTKTNYNNIDIIEPMPKPKLLNIGHYGNILPGFDNQIQAVATSVPLSVAISTLENILGHCTTEEAFKRSISDAIETYRAYSLTEEQIRHSYDGIKLKIKKKK